tara:strand:+ start:392 stop:790 length:399 start_codon:yes stop_codon:yes gene_type:complete
MSFRIIQLEDLPVKIISESDSIRMAFIDAYIRKTMDDAEEKTLWKQDGEILLKKVKKNKLKEYQDEKISEISVSYDFYTYKNMLILPFEKKGDIYITIKFNKMDYEINIECELINILLRDKPKYVRHIKKTE